MIEAIRSWLYAGRARRLKREAEMDALRRRNLSLEYTNQSLRKECETVGADLDNAAIRLSRIAALETPRCAHIGKVAAAIARGEK